MWNSFLFPETIKSRRRRLIYIRPVFLMAVFFMVGIWISYSFQVPFVSFCLMNLVLLSISFFWVHQERFLIAVVLIFMITGILFGTESRTFPKNDIGNAAVEGFAVLEGKVVSVPEVSIKGRKETVSFVLDLHNFFRRGSVFNAEGKVQVFLHNPGRTIYFGDELRIKGKFEISKKTANPHVFDYREYLQKNGIHAQFRGIGKFSILKQTPENPRLISRVNQLRIYLKEKLDRLFPEPLDALSGALILGFKKNIPREIKDDFIKTGTAHILAISGFNITLVAGFFYLLLSLLRMPRWIHLSLTALLIAIYTVLAGADPPVLRAGIMGIVVLAGFLMEEERHIKTALFFSFFVLLIADPKMLFLASFQLTFLATAALIFILPGIEKIFFSKLKPTRLIRLNFGMRVLKFLTQIFVTSFSVTIGMFPVLIGYFNQFSLNGFLANAFAIPVCSAAIIATLIILILNLTGFTTPFILNLIPTALLNLELKGVQFFARIPFGVFFFPKPNVFFFIFYYSFLMIWLLLSKTEQFHKWRKLSFIGFLLTVAFYLVSARPEKSNVQFFDLGKTNAALVSFSNGARILINTGRSFPNDQAYWIIRPYLMANGIDRLDGVLMTKVDQTHSGGFKTLRSHVKVKNLWVPLGSDSEKCARYLPGNGKVILKTISKGEKIQIGSDPESYIEILDLKRNEISELLISDGRYKMPYFSSVHKEAEKVIFKEKSAALSRPNFH